MVGCVILRSDFQVVRSVSISFLVCPSVRRKSKTSRSNLQFSSFLDHPFNDGTSVLLSCMLHCSRSPRDLRINQFTQPPCPPVHPPIMATWPPKQSRKTLPALRHLLALFRPRLRCSTFFFASTRPALASTQPQRTTSSPSETSSWSERSASRSVWPSKQSNTTAAATAETTSCHSPRIRARCPRPPICEPGPVCFRTNWPAFRPCTAPRTPTRNSVPSAVES